MGSRIRTWTLRLILVAATILATLVIGGGLDARRRHPELKPWHRLVPSAEMTAADLTDATTLPEYLGHEAAVFDQVRREIEQALAETDRTATNRYNPAGVSSPSRLPRDYNRTFELTPDDVRGRRAPHPRTDRFSVLDACARGVPARRGLLHAVAADARAWRRARRVDAGHLAGLDRGRAPGRTPRARPDRALEAARPRGLFERRRAGGEVRARPARRASDPRPDRLLLAVTDDRRHAVRAPVERHQRAVADPVFRPRGMARRPAGIQPVQVQFLPCQRGASDLRSDQAIAARSIASGPMAGSRTSLPS